jgi:hypothetical protein
MTIFGNRDFGQRELTTDDVGDPNDSDDPVTTESAPVATEDAPASPLFAVDHRRVILRINGDQDIVVGRAEGREPAVEIAREMVRHIEAASARGEWPQIDERFVRPGAIVSVDVQRGE